MEFVGGVKDEETMTMEIMSPMPVMSGRHAYCILAHNEPEILQVLVSMIDDDRNDVFIHIDAKSDMTQFDGVRTMKSKLVWTPRVKTYWGGPSQMVAERTVLKCAYEHGPYARYHLLSGVDLPIKSQDYIHEFCDVKYRDKEFVGFDEAADNDEEFRAQWSLYHVLDDYRHIDRNMLRKCCSLVRRTVMFFQRLLRLSRHPPCVIKKGTNWVSMSQLALDSIFSDAGNAVFRFMLHVHCADEKWKQTIVWNSRRDNVFDITDEMRGCMRAIDWQRGKPYVWQRSDFDELRHSDKLFARKFSSKDMDVVRDIANAILGKT